MKLKVSIYLIFLTIYPTICLAETPLTIESLTHGVVATLIYGVIGIVMACVGFKAVDLLTPGNLSEDISENKNMPLAVLASSMILGICIIIAAAITG